MRCARCHKPLDKPALWVGGNAIGPKCAEKMGLVKTKVKIKPIRNDQDDLFGFIPTKNTEEPSDNTQTEEIWEENSATNQSRS